MNRARSGTGASLSGAWSGVYSYSGDVKSPVAFTASLTQDGPWIVGTSEEVAEVGRTRGASLSATLRGRRDGARVGWLKLYDRMLRAYDEVAYEGAINQDATEISGRWTIPGNWSGPFLMIRAPVRALSRQRETERRL